MNTVINLIKYLLNMSKTVIYFDIQVVNAV